jgi:GDPmannose 4,6-dehydratase
LIPLNPGSKVLHPSAHGFFSIKIKPMRRAIIIGHQGQDGQLLWNELANQGYDLLGWGREAVLATESGWHLPVDIRSYAAVSAAIQAFRPDEIYHFAAFHHSSEQHFTEDVSLFQQSVEINLMSVLNVLQAMQEHAPRARLFYAASSRIFGSATDELQTETSPVRPFCAYGITKVSGLHACRYFRAKYGTYASVGILFNHESKLRPPHFLSKKIITAALEIRQGRTEKLVLGNLQTGADWGYAPDTIEAIHGMLQLPAPDDFIIATGEKHTVEEFVDTAFQSVGLDWREHVVERGEILREVRPILAGDATKFHLATGWKPRRTFGEMVRQLIVDEGGGAHLI